jgi:hypothetical protein
LIVVDWGAADGRGNGWQLNPKCRSGAWTVTGRFDVPAVRLDYAARNG